MIADLIVPSESAAHFEEALQVFWTRDPNWNPSFFMTDYSVSDIAALEATFPGTTVYFCDFHREHAGMGKVGQG